MGINRPPIYRTEDGMICFFVKPRNVTHPNAHMHARSFVELPKFAKNALDTIGKNRHEAELDFYLVDGPDQVGAFVGKAVYVHGQPRFFFMWQEAELAA